MKRVAAVIIGMLICVTANASCAILLHGLWRSPASLMDMQAALEENGFRVVNQGYESREASIDVLANQAIPTALRECGDDDVYFVTHSLGGILVRQYLSQQPIKRLKRVVMLGPPNQGSEVIDVFGGVYGFGLINGPASLQLGTDDTSTPNALGAVDFELAVIAGNRSVNWLLSGIITGKDDGKVAVDKTKVEGMKHHTVLPVNHVTMMNNADVIRYVVSYLSKGVWPEVKGVES